MKKDTNTNFHLAIKKALCADKKNTGSLMQNLTIHEIYFYQNIWRSLEKFQKDFHGITFSLVPKSYAFSLVLGREILILENLKHSGYKTLPKDASFDDSHLKLALEAYGKFHGISAAFRKYNPSEYIKLTKDVDKSFDTLLAEDFFQTYLGVYIQNTRDNLNDERMKVKMAKYIENYMDILKNSMKYNGKNPVIIHGDCWSSNLMFKYDVSIIVNFSHTFGTNNDFEKRSKLTLLDNLEITKVLIE